MGYRPDIMDTKRPELRFYDTKLYGYVDHEQLSSFKYLLSIGKVDEDVIWDYSWQNEMILTAEEFRKFMPLYEKEFDELMSFGKLKDYYDYNIIQELLKTDNDKHIEWG
jgi:hypothetical protein